MCNDQRRSAFRKLVEALLYIIFRHGVECGRRFIEDQDARVFQEQPRNRNTLLLPAGELHAAFADFGLILIRKRHDFIMDMCADCCLYDFFIGRVQAAVANVLENRSGEQEHVLLNDTDVSSE